MKTEPCKCCKGSGTQYDNVATGKEMKALRVASGLTLAGVGARMRPTRKAGYLWDLEDGNRNWNDALVASYNKICR